MNSIEHNYKKRLGQNFLQEKSIVNKIVSSIKIEPNDLIIEIGPGSGVLSKELVKYAPVLAYEIDTDLKDILTKNVNSDNFNVLWKDFLQSDLKNDIESYNYKKIHVVANLPYYITTPIILKIIESNLEFENILIMVQEEVADRFCSLPGSRKYSSITVFLNYYFDINKIFKVSKNCFYPKPNVDSAVILFKRKPIRIKSNNEEILFQLIKDSFKFKRKTLKNNLKSYDLKKIENVLKKYDFDLSTRAEELPLEVYIDISNNI